MYKMIYVDNCEQRENYDIFEKEFETKEEADRVYEELFSLVKASIVEEMEGYISVNPQMSQVLQQIIEVIKNLNMDEEIVLKAQETPFLTMDKGQLEFTFMNRHIVLKMQA